MCTKQNVYGIFIQVIGLAGGSLSTYYYYDVPEAAGVSDPVSLIQLGYNPAGYKPPLSYSITIIPYSNSGQPIIPTTIPVKFLNTTPTPIMQVFVALYCLMEIFGNG